MAALKRTKVTNIQLPEEAIYKMKAIRTTNDRVRGKTYFGELYSNPIAIDRQIMLGDLVTSLVREIELRSDGKVSIKTLNTTYLLEEVNKLSAIG